VATIDSQLKERTAAMDKLDQHVNEAAAALNRRLGILAEREREQVEIERALTALQNNRTASEAEVAALQSRINERLKVLGEREQALAEYETKARLAAYKVSQLQAEAANVEPRLTAMKGELGQVDVELAARQRAINESFGRVAKAKAALDEIRQLISQ
jgi:chromosome segregation ATPase